MNNPVSILGLSFVTPALFYAGAAAVAAPILIHLFARRRFRRIRWAAMDFLLEAERRNRRRLRMEEWILLVLRCVAVVLIGLLVARPFVSPTGIAAAWGGSSRTERIILLDDSLSMGYETTQGEVFSRAKAAVQRLLDIIRREAPDDTVTLLRMTEPEAPLESGAFLNTAQTEALRARLNALTVTQRAQDPARVLEAAAELLKRQPDVMNAAVYIVSDMQQADWVQREASAGSVSGARDLFDPFKKWAAERRGLHVVFVNVGAPDAVNRALVEWELARGQLVAGATLGWRAHVANYSDKPAEQVELRLTLGNVPRPPVTTGVIAPRQTAQVELSAEFPRAGSDWAKIELPPDGLMADNVRYLAAEVAPALRVVVVNGEPARDAYDDEVTFLRTALRPEGEVFSGNEVTVLEEAELERATLQGVHVVILANVYRVSDPMVDMLERFVRDGGGLMIFLGDQVDATLYNGSLYRDGQGLLPARLGERVRSNAPILLHVVDRLHPAMRGLAQEGDPLGLSRVPFFEYFSATPFTPESEEEELGRKPESAAGAVPQPASVSRQGARVLLGFQDAEQRPAIVERSVGKGRVLLITTSADKEWHHWPDHPTFLPVVMELVHHVARRGDPGGDHFVGQPVDIPLDPAVYAPDVFVRTPRFPGEPETSLTAVPSEDGAGLTLHWPHTEQAGLYQFLFHRRDGGESLRWIAVNVDPRESDLSTCDETMLRRALPGLRFDYVAGLDKLSGEAGEARVEWWRGALALAFFTLMIEQTLAWRWGRRR